MNQKDLGRLQELFGQGGVSNEEIYILLQDMYAVLRRLEIVARPVSDYDIINQRKPRGSQQ